MSDLLTAENMIEKVTGAQIAWDYKRRNIAPDHIERVAEGILAKWLFNNSWVCELLVSCDNYADRNNPGQLSLFGGPFINTYTSQEIVEYIVCKSFAVQRTN